MNTTVEERAVELGLYMIGMLASSLNQVLTMMILSSLSIKEKRLERMYISCQRESILACFQRGELT